MSKCNEKTLLQTCKQMQNEGKDIESILLFLKQNGCSKIDSMRVIISLMGISLNEAKQVIHFSKTWEDSRKDDEEFQDQLAEFVDKLEGEDK